MFLDQLITPLLVMFLFKMIESFFLIQVFPAVGIFHLNINFGAIGFLQEENTIVKRSKINQFFI